MVKTPPFRRCFGVALRVSGTFLEGVWTLRVYRIPGMFGPTAMLFCYVFFLYKVVSYKSIQITLKQKNTSDRTLLHQKHS